MGAACSTPENGATTASGTASPRTASAPAAQLKANHDDAPVLQAPKEKLANGNGAPAAAAKEEPAAKQPETKAAEPAPQAKEAASASPAPEDSRAPVPSDLTRHGSIPPGTQADFMTPELKFDALLEQERVKRTRRRSALGGAAGDFAGQMEGDIPPDVLAMMQAAGAEMGPAAVSPVVPVKAEQPAEAPKPAPAPAAEEKAPAPAVLSAERKPAAAEETPAPAAEKPAAGDKVVPAEEKGAKAGHKPAAVEQLPSPEADEGNDKGHHATFSADTPDDKTEAASTVRGYSRGKTGVTSIHSTCSGASEQSDLEGDNMDGALHDEVSATAMNEAPESCDNALFRGTEAIKEEKEEEEQQQAGDAAKQEEAA